MKYVAGNASLFSCSNEPLREMTADEFYGYFIGYLAPLADTAVGRRGTDSTPGELNIFDVRFAQVLLYQPISIRNNAAI